MSWVLLWSLRAAATEFPVDESGCVYGGAPPDSDGDGLIDDIELDYTEDDFDSDEDGCPDINDPDDDGDGLPTFDEDFNGDGNWTNDTERVVLGDNPWAWLDRADPFDDDGDGFLDVNHGGDDCHDSYSGVYPGGTEVWYDGLDGDCNGSSDYDQDGDGVDDALRGNGDDCDDLDAEVRPGLEEDAGPVDRDCDTFSDPHHALEARGGCVCEAVPSGGLGGGWVAAVALALVRSRRGRRT